MSCNAYLVTAAAERVRLEEVLAAVPEELTEPLLGLIPPGSGQDGAEGEDSAAAEEEAERVGTSGLTGGQLGIRQPQGSSQSLSSSLVWQKIFQKEENISDCHPEKE